MPGEVRRERNRILRELAAAKNLAFRSGFVGRSLSVVTLLGGQAISSNYLTVELARSVPANELCEVRIGNVTPQGLAEAGALTVLP